MACSSFFDVKVESMKTSYFYIPISDFSQLFYELFIGAKEKFFTRYFSFPPGTT